jgi:hypothetical protein
MTLARSALSVCYGARAELNEITPLLLRLTLLFFAGAEFAVLMAWMPDTLRQWWHAGTLAPSDDRPMGDWQVFYAYARDLEANGLYSPILPVLQHPFTWLRIDVAYRAYTSLSVACVLATAWLAQRHVQSPEAKLAVVLGVVSLPQTHWALRGATLTPFLALAGLGGFSAMNRRPSLAGILFAILTLKPQFALVPFAYLVFSRRWLALRAAFFVSIAAAVIGLAIVGFGYTTTYLHMLVDWGPDQRDNLSPIAQTWQHTWPGVLRSIGAEPHPLLWLDLIALSLLAFYYACRRADASLQGPAGALGMLIGTPYAMFYDWALLAVAGALLLAAHREHSVLVPSLLVVGYAVAVLTQVATPYPPPFPIVDAGVIRWPASTYGLYLSAPFALVALVAIALFGKPREGAEPAS